MPDLTDAQLLEVFKDKRADLSLLTASEQSRLLDLTDPAKQKQAFDPRTAPLITGMSHAQEMRGVAGQLQDPGAVDTVQTLQRYGENTGAGLGLGALTGSTSALGNAVMKGAVIPGMLYQGGQAVGVPPTILNTILAASSLGSMPSIRRAWQGAPMPETPLPTNELIEGPPRMWGGGSRLYNTNAQLDALSRAPGPPPEPTPTAPVPRLSSITRGTSQWRSLDPAEPQAPAAAPTVPQQTSSIQPTPNAFVNVDKPQPLPSDNPSGYHTETTGKGTGERMQAAHKIIKAEDANYQGAVADLKATVGPDFLKALLDSLNRGGR